MSDNNRSDSLRRIVELVSAHQAPDKKANSPFIQLNEIRSEHFFSFLKNIIHFLYNVTTLSST